ncbi:MAG: hypothetical protein AAF957_08730 [Planctomycetota bacterium]
MLAQHRADLAAVAWRDGDDPEAPRQAVIDRRARDQESALRDARERAQPVQSREGAREVGGPQGRVELDEPAALQGRRRFDGGRERREVRLEAGLDPRGPQTDRRPAADVRQRSGPHRELLHLPIEGDPGALRRLR